MPILTRRPLPPSNVISIQPLSAMYTVYTGEYERRVGQNVTFGFGGTYWNSSNDDSGGDVTYTSGDTEGSITAASPSDPTRYDRLPFPVRRTRTMRTDGVRGRNISGIPREKPRRHPACDRASKPRPARISAAVWLTRPALQIVTTG